MSSNATSAVPCAPTGADGTAAFTLPAGTYQVRSEAPASQRRVDADGVPVSGQGGASVGVDLTKGDGSVRGQLPAAEHGHRGDEQILLPGEVEAALDEELPAVRGDDFPTAAP